MGIKNLYFLFIGRIVSTIGDEFYTIALSVSIYLVSGSVLKSVGFLAIKGIIHTIGLFTYRNFSILKQKKIAVISDFARFILILCMIPCFKINYLSVYLFVIVLEFIQMYYSPARFVLVNNISENEKKHKLNVFDQLITTVALAAGTALGGVVAYKFGYEVALLIDATSFLISGLLTTFVKIDYVDDRKIPDNKRGIYKWLKGEKELFKKYLILCFPLIFLPATGFNSLLVVFVLKGLSLDSRYYGFLESIMTIGLFSGSLLAFKLANKTPFRLLILSIISMGTFYFLSVQTKMIYIINMFLFLSAVFNALFVSSYRIIISKSFQRENELGMIWGIYRSLNAIFSAIGILIFATMADHVSIVIVQSLCGVTIIILGILFAIIPKLIKINNVYCYEMSINKYRHELSKE